MSSRFNPQSGIALIGVIVGITVVAALGAGVTNMTSGTAINHVSMVDQNRAYSLAESGLRAAFRQPGTYMPPAPVGGAATGAVVTYTVGADQVSLQQINSGSDIRVTGTVNIGTPLQARRVIVVSAQQDEWEQVGDPVVDTMDTGSHTLWGANKNAIMTAIDAWNSTDKYLRNKNSTTREHQDVTVSKDAWLNSGHTLSYDAQTKVAWWSNLNYASTGLAVRYHEVAPNKSAFLGYSYMRYGPASQDVIPEVIKPVDPETGSRQEKWTMLVLWRQDVVGNTITREWIAAKKLFYLPEKQEYVGEPQAYVQSIGSKWDGILNDNSGLVIRVLEIKDQVPNYLLVRCYYTDANKNHPTRLPNDISHDIKQHRRLYMPSYKYADDVQVFPAFPPENKWNAAEDYFTFATESFAWDYVNPAAAAKGYELQADGGTFKITDPRFISPEGSQVFDRNEFALHSFNQESIVFNDFAARYLRKKQ